MTKTLRITTWLAAMVSLVGCASMKVTHTAPGTSVEVALAKKAELVKMPAPVVAPAAPGSVAAAAPNVPAVEPAMPDKDSVTEKVGDAFSRGIFCLRAERDDEAILA